MRPTAAVDKTHLLAAHSVFPVQPPYAERRGCRKICRYFGIARLPRGVNGDFGSNLFDSTALLFGFGSETNDDDGSLCPADKRACRFVAEAMHMSRPAAPQE